MLDAGFAALEARGFRVSGSDIGSDDLAAVFTAMVAKAKPITATKAIGSLIEAHAEAKEHGRITGTSNWAGHIWNLLIKDFRK